MELTQDRRAWYVDKLVTLTEQSIYNAAEAHLDADDLLCALLIQLGYEEIVNQYEKVHKWFS